MLPCKELNSCDLPPDFTLTPARTGTSAPLRVTPGIEDPTATREDRRRNKHATRHALTDSSDSDGAQVGPRNGPLRALAPTSLDNGPPDKPHPALTRQSPWQTEPRPAKSSRKPSLTTGQQYVGLLLAATFFNRRIAGDPLLGAEEPRELGQRLVEAGAVAPGAEQLEEACVSCGRSGARRGPPAGRRRGAEARSSRTPASRAERTSRVGSGSRRAPRRDRGRVLAGRTGRGA